MRVQSRFGAWLALVLCALMIGCAGVEDRPSTPAQWVAFLNYQYGAVMNTLAAARSRGDLTASQIQSIDENAKRARDGLTRARVGLELGQMPMVDLQLELVRTLLIELTKIAKEKERR